jgi:hypothetical protein
LSRVIGLRPFSQKSGRAFLTHGLVHDIVERWLFGRHICKALAWDDEVYLFAFAARNCRGKRVIDRKTAFFEGRINFFQTIIKRLALTLFDVPGRDRKIGVVIQAVWPDTNIILCTPDNGFSTGYM